MAVYLIIFAIIEIFFSPAGEQAERNFGFCASQRLNFQPDTEARRGECLLYRHAFLFDPF